MDDVAAVAEMVGDRRAATGHAARRAADGPALRGAAAREAADLAVLDFNLPGETQRVRVPMLTAVDSTFDRIAGIVSGAEDYLTKPFAPAELVARVGAILRRMLGGAEAGPVAPGLLPFGAHAFDPATGRLLAGHGAPIPLTAMDAELVAAPAAPPGRVPSPHDLLDLAPSRGADPFDRSIDSRVARLRRRIEVDPGRPRILRPVGGAGDVLARSSAGRGGGGGAGERAGQPRPGAGERLPDHSGLRRGRRAPGRRAAPPGASDLSPRRRRQDPGPGRSQQPSRRTRGAGSSALALPGTCRRSVPRKGLPPRGPWTCSRPAPDELPSGSMAKAQAVPPGRARSPATSAPRALRHA